MRSPTLRKYLLACAVALPGCSEGGERADRLVQVEGGSAAERLEALRLVSHSPLALDLAQLRLLLDDPSPSVRALAISIAAQRKEPQVVEWIGRRVEDADPEVRRAALEALRAFPSEAREPYLVAAYPLQDLAGRKAIVDELADRDEKLLRLIRGEAERLWQRHLVALREGGVAEFEGALELIGRSGRAEAVELLARLVESDSTRIAIAAARGLGWSGAGDEAREALEGLLASEIPERRAAGFAALVRLGFSPPEEEGEADETAEGEALHAARPEEGRDSLDVRLADFERKRDAEAVAQIFRRTGSVQAAAALGRLGKAEAARPLLDPKAAGKVTPAWILSLEKVGGEIGAAAARLHLAHDRPEIRAASAEVLGRRCDWEAMPLLRALAAEDYFVEVRLSAEAAVQAIRSCPR